jgi:pyridinium-3,5-biscarboxylic acid mononucleotide sulfurtransferase
MDQSPTISNALAEKRDRLRALLASYGSCAVAFSGGLDSAVLAKAARLALGDRAVAVTGTSQSLASGELDQARDLARQIGIRHEIVACGEMSDPNYQANTADRCYYCKTEVLRRIKETAARLGLAVVADGANRDDGRDHRPGMRAVREQGVRSPLAECDLGKEELRRLAADWGLPVWNKPATPCLSSRIAYGETITPERLAMIDKAERFLRERGFQPLRVRYHRGDVARIEVASDAISRLLEPELCRDVIAHLKSVGFKYVSVDIEGFRSGSLNETLSAESLRIQDRE